MGKAQISHKTNCLTTDTVVLGWENMSFLVSAGLNGKWVSEDTPAALFSEGGCTYTCLKVR